MTAVKLSLSGSKGSSSSSLVSFRNHPSFQALRRAISGHSPHTTTSALSNTINTTITTPSSTIASCGGSQTGPHAPPQLDATTLSQSTSSSATTPAITSCSSSGPTATATAATTPTPTRPSFSLPPPEDVIKLLLSTTIYIYNSLTKLIDTNNVLRGPNSRIPGDQPICQAEMLRSAAKSPRTAIPVKGSSSTSCPNGIAHDALHIVNSHRAFARAIEAEIAKLNAALGYFSPLSHSSRLRSFVPSLPTPIRGGGLRAKLSKKHKCTGGERVTIWSDIGKIICMYDWLWTYSYSASVKNWQEVIWACAVVTGVYGAGGLEGVNARMRDYGISHAGVVDSLYVAYRAREKEAEKRQALVTRIGNQMINTMQDGPKKRVIVKRRRMTKVDGKWVQVDPRVIAAQVKEGEMVNGLQVGAGCTDRRWKVKVQVPGGVMAVGLKIKILRKIIKGKEKEKCRREARGEAEGAIKEDLSDEEYEKAMWG